MPDRELVLREKCEHGSTWGHSCAAHPQCALFRGDAHRCPGGSETVLDPERVVENVSVMQDVTTVADVRVRWFLDALGGSDE